MKIKYKIKPLELKVGDKVKIDGNNSVLLDKYSHWSLKNVLDCEFEITHLNKQYKKELCIQTKLITKGIGLGNTWNIPKELIIKLN